MNFNNSSVISYPKRIFLITTFTMNLCLLAGNVLAQNQANQQKAKAYYIQAEAAYEGEEYSKTLEYLDQVMVLLGGQSNATIESLRAKTFYEMEEYSQAKKALTRFFEMEPQTSLLEEMSDYLIKIDEALEKERLAEIARKEKTRKAELARLEKERQEELARKEKMRQAELKKQKAAKLKLRGAKIIRRHLQARGGRQRIQEIRSFKKITVNPRNGYYQQIVSYYAHPDKFRRVIGDWPAIIFVLNKDQLWVDWMTGDLRPASELQVMGYLPHYTLLADIEGPFINTHEKGLTIEYEGRTDLAGSPVDVFLVAGYPGNMTTRFYIDTQTFLIVKRDIKYTYTDPVTDVNLLNKYEYTFSDFRKVDGFPVPYTIKVVHSFKKNGVLASVSERIESLHSIDINVALDEDLFTGPKNGQEEPK